MQLYGLHLFYRPGLYKRSPQFHSIKFCTMKKLLLFCFILTAPFIILFINVMNIGAFVIQHLFTGRK